MLRTEGGDRVTRLQLSPEIPEPEVLGGGQTHLLGEGLQLLFGVNVLPDPLHVVPVLHDAVLHRVPHRQQAPVLLAAKSGEDSLEKANKNNKMPWYEKKKTVWR